MISATKRRIKRALGPMMRSLRHSERGTLTPEHWGLDVDPQGHITFEGVDLASLREQWGSPLHVVLADRDRDIVEHAESGAFRVEGMMGSSGEGAAPAAGRDATAPC